MKPNIGIFSDSYPDKRLIIGKIPECHYIQLHGKRELLNKCLCFIGKKSKRISHSMPYAKRVYFTLDNMKDPEVEVIHTFNRIILNRETPWVSTFEKTIPAYFCSDQRAVTQSMKKQVPFLLSEKCLGLLPMSKWAYQYETWLVKQLAGQNAADQVKEKMMVLYPPQDIISSVESTRFKNQQL